MVIKEKGENIKIKVFNKLDKNKESHVLHCKKRKVYHKIKWVMELIKYRATVNS